MCRTQKGAWLTCAEKVPVAGGGGALGVNGTGGCAGGSGQDAVPQIQDHLPHTHILMQGNTLNTPGDNNLFYEKVIHLKMFKEIVVLTGPVSLLSSLPPSTHTPSPASALNRDSPEW